MWGIIIKIRGSTWNYSITITTKKDSGSRSGEQQHVGEEEVPLKNPL